MPRRHTFAIALATALLGLLLSACGAAPTADEPTSPPAAQRPTRDPESSAASKPTAEAPPPAAPTAAESNESLVIDNLEEGLKNLNGYRVTFTTIITNAATGEEQTFSYNVTTGANGDMHMVTESFAGMGEQLETYTIGDRFYIITSDGGTPSCMSLATDGASTDMVTSPSDMLGTVEGSELVERNVEVNGVTTNHFRVVAPTSFGLMGDNGETGADAWVSVDGGYVVRYVGYVSGAGVANGAEGTVSWVYDVTEMNQVATIELPEICANQDAASNPLIPDNAANVSSMGGMTIFTTTDDPATVTAFYNERLPADGWSAGDQQQMAGMSILKFTKDGSTISITITSDNTTTSVMITQE